ncbi:hypothetical protein SY88_22360 [Clostridiales bacterium PH28_bin88]|nr:hypothetical protein SY88_22360 [Clostridiales bacterium PH28_bin88]
MLTKEKIDRINELARKQRKKELSPEEREEQSLLRREYVEAVKTSLRQTLDSIKIVDAYDTECQPGCDCRHHKH